MGANGSTQHQLLSFTYQERISSDSHRVRKAVLSLKLLQQKKFEIRFQVMSPVIRHQLKPNIPGKTVLETPIWETGAN